VLESNQDYLKLCEIEAFGVAVKESTVCGQEGAGCPLVVCRQGLVCSGGGCKVGLGSGCSVDKDCEDPVSQMCSDVSHQCKLRVGESCYHRENHCYERLQCDAGFTWKCQFKRGENCTGRPGSCVTPLVCDYKCGCKIRTDGGMHSKR
jgi:hypothetical protein